MILLDDDDEDIDYHREAAVTKKITYYTQKTNQQCGSDDSQM